MKLKNYLLVLKNKENRKHKENICIYGVSSIIKLVYLDIKKRDYGEIKSMLNKLKIPYQTIYSWISGSNPIPISKTYNLINFWQKSCNLTEKEFIEKWDLIYEENKGFSQNGQRRVVLPKEINENLGYLVGFFQGDGHLKKENTKGFQEYSIYFYEGNKKILENINIIIQKEFGISGNIYLGTNKKDYKCYTLRISSKPIYNFFKNILKLKTGKKVRNIETPEIIKKSELPIQLSFIKGFFDAEGGVGETKKNPWLDLGQASKETPCEILIWIKDKLNESGIILSEPRRTKNQEYFRIRTAKRETIKRFFNIVSSEHIEKINKFKKIIKKCQM